MLITSSRRYRYRLFCLSPIIAADYFVRCLLFHAWRGRGVRSLKEMSANWSLRKTRRCSCYFLRAETTYDGDRWYGSHQLGVLPIVYVNCVNDIRNCCYRPTRFVVIWKHFCFILSTGTKTRIDSVMCPRSSGRNTSVSVTVTVTHCLTSSCQLTQVSKQSVV